jgi:hypothetical protein
MSAGGADEIATGSLNFVVVQKARIAIAAFQTGKERNLRDWRFAPP